MSKKVLVAMSGGVDSSVAAMLLKKEGYDVSGVTMCLGIAAEGGDARCCGADAIDDAKSVCDRLQIPHYVFDYAAQLEDKVIAKFISEYKKGRTPNPCVECNRHLKFSNLLDKALTLGFDFLATGHYASIEKYEDGYCLKRPKDKKKDQTYFLYPIPYGKLESILFPLAYLTKDEVREMAKKDFLPVADKQESQGYMFCNTEKLSGVSFGKGAGIKARFDCGYAGKNSGQSSGNYILHNRPAGWTGHQPRNAIVCCINRSRCKPYCCR
jgi:tRNA-specific 2-thiouridylase